MLAKMFSGDFEAATLDKDGRYSQPARIPHLGSGILCRIQPPEPLLPVCPGIFSTEMDILSSTCWRIFEEALCLLLPMGMMQSS